MVVHFKVVMCREVNVAQLVSLPLILIEEWLFYAIWAIYKSYFLFVLEYYMIIF